MVICLIKPLDPASRLGDPSLFIQASTGHWLLSTGQHSWSTGFSPGQPGGQVRHPWDTLFDHWGLAVLIDHLERLVPSRLGIKQIGEIGNRFVDSLFPWC